MFGETEWHNILHMQTKIKIMALFALTSFLSCLAIGCATSYHSSGFTGGFSDTQLAPDVFRVNFRGNGYTSSERVQDFAMLRAADLCSQHDFVCFAVIDENDSSAAYNYTTAGQSYTSGTAYSFGNTTTYSGSTTYYPGQTYTFYKPKTGLMVRCFSKPPDGIYTFNAQFLAKSIKQKYHIK